MSCKMYKLVHVFGTFQVFVVIKKSCVTMSSQQNQAYAQNPQSSDLDPISKYKRLIPRLKDVLTVRLRFKHSMVKFWAIIGEPTFLHPSHVIAVVL